MGIALLIIGLLLLVGGAFYLIKSLRAFVKNHKVRAYEKADLIKFGASLAAIGIAAALLQEATIQTKQWNIDGFRHFVALLGAFLFFVFFVGLWASFYLRYWKTNLEAKHLKITKFVMFSCIALSLLSFLMLGEGVANYLTYPLVAGFSIDGTGFHWTRFNQSVSGFHINFYGVIIVFSALVAYWISDHRFYQKYGKHGILDTCLLIAFPSGIIGARIWYVVGNWNGDPTFIASGGTSGISFAKEVANGNWFSIFEMWNGGLTILGGAVGGIIGGVIYMLLRRKYVDIRYAMDMIVPTIIIAQAIGRWGNFFNHEVYGAAVSYESWGFLPTWLKYQMSTNFLGTIPPSTAGQMYIPLFLIEGCINILGYFVIAWIVPSLWKIEKGRAMGDISGFYLIWYGITRMIMEPLRDSEFNMGTNGQWSFWNSMVYIILGLALIGFFQGFAYYRKKKGLPLEMDLSKKNKKAKAAVAVTPAAEEIPTEKTPEEITPIFTVPEEKKSTKKKSSDK